MLDIPGYIFDAERNRYFKVGSADAQHIKGKKESKQKQKPKKDCILNSLCDRDLKGSVVSVFTCKYLPFKNIRHALNFKTTNSVHLFDETSMYFIPNIREPDLNLFMSFSWRILSVSADLRPDCAKYAACYDKGCHIVSVGPDGITSTPFIDVHGENAKCYDGKLYFTRGNALYLVQGEVARMPTKSDIVDYLIGYFVIIAQRNGTVTIMLEAKQVHRLQVLPVVRLHQLESYLIIVSTESVTVFDLVLFKILYTLNIGKDNSKLPVSAVTENNICIAHQNCLKIYPLFSLKPVYEMELEGDCEALCGIGDMLVVCGEKCFLIE